MRTIAPGSVTGLAIFLAASTVVRAAAAVEESPLFEGDTILDVVAIGLLLIMGIGLALLVRQMSAKG